MTNRLFIALKLPQDIREEIVSISRNIYHESAAKRWEPEDKLHLTIKFLGYVEDDRTQEISDTFSESAAGYKKILGSYEKFGFFLPRILWLSLRTEDHLFRLVEELEERFSQIGFKKEDRSFKTHITLLRMKENPDTDFINAFRNYKLPQKEFYINEAALIKSTLKPSGSVYTDIKKIILHNGG